MLKRITIVLLISIISFVVTTGVCYSTALAEKQTSNRDEVIFTLEKAIASKYYDFKKRRVIRVYLNDFTSSVDDNGLLKDYFYDGISTSLEEANQFVLGDFDQIGVDCLVGMSLQSLGKKFIKIDAEVMDGQSGQVVATVSKTYPKATFYDQQFADFRADHELRMEQARQIGQTRLVVFVDSSGNSMDEFDVSTSTYSSSYGRTAKYDGQYEDSDNYSASGTGDYQSKSNYQSTYEHKEKIGRSSVYPTDIMIYINNRPYQPNSEGIAFDQLVEPGSYQVIVKFRKAFWDGVRKNEVKGRSFTRKFRVDMTKDDYTRFDIGIQLKGDDAKVVGKARQVD